MKRLRRITIVASLLWRANFNAPLPRGWFGVWEAMQLEAERTSADELDARALYAACTRVRREMQARLHVAREAAARATDNLVAAECELTRWVENELLAAQHVMDLRAREDLEQREAEHVRSVA